MSTYKERDERKEMASRVADLLRMPDPILTISAKDLAALARAHPLLRDMVPNPSRRKNGYWNTREGEDEAKTLIAGFKAENGRLPNVADLGKMGIVAFYQSRFTASTRDSRIGYIRFLYYIGYKPEEIASARMNGVHNANKVEELLSDVLRRD